MKTTYQLHITFDAGPVLASVSIKTGAGEGQWVELASLNPADPARLAARGALMNALGIGADWKPGELALIALVGGTGASQAFYARQVTGLEMLGASMLLHELAERVGAKVLGDMAKPPPPEPDEPGH